MQTNRPLAMKKDGLQTRKRKQKGTGTGTGKSKSKNSKHSVHGEFLLYSIRSRAKVLRQNLNKYLDLYTGQEYISV